MVSIRVEGTGNLGPLAAQFDLVTKQIEQMNAAMLASTQIPLGGNVKDFRKLQSTITQGTSAYNAMLTASGSFRAEQVRLTSAVDKTTEKLVKQDLAFNKVFGKKNKAMMRAVYEEHLAMQKAYGRVTQGIVGDGKTRMSLAIPTQIHKSWDTLNNQIGMFRSQLASASNQLVNWGKNTQWAGRQLMTGFTMPVAIFGAAAGTMAYKADKELTRIAKVYDTTADASSGKMEAMAAVEAELSELRADGMKTATAAAAEYGAQMESTLSVQAELAAVGLKGQTLQESTSEVMRISMLGELEHADATQALISLQTVLGHTAKETADDFNYLNSVENATSLSTQDFAAAIPVALAPMKQMGGSLQDLAVLLVGMKERGIAASEGANAIKSMMQRLYRPSNKVREEWQKLAGVDPMKFVEESGGNVMEILPKIADATRDLDEASKVKALAGLFGTYQVTRMSAMLEGIDAMNNGLGQTSRVLEINAQDTKEWADTADKEVKRVQESAAGKLKATWATLQAQLASVGEPFMEVASQLLSLTGKVLKFFNGLSDGTKKWAAKLAIAVAVIGPVIMLVGLFANLAGNLGKAGAFILKFASSTEIMTKSQWAAQLAAKMTDSAFVKQVSSAELLEKQLMDIARASEYSAMAMAKLARIGTLPPHIQQAAATGAAARAQGTLQIGGVGGANGPMGRYAADSQRQMLHNQVASSRAALATQTATQKTEKSINGAAISMGAFAVGAAMSASSSNLLVDHMGKTLMAAAIVVPMMSSLGPIMVAMAGKAKIAATAVWSQAAGASATGAAMTRAAGATAVFGAAAKGALAGINAMLGPIGWITLAVGGIYSAISYMNKREDELAKKERERHKKALAANKALASTAKNFADEIGRSGEGYQKFLTHGFGGEHDPNPNRRITSEAYYYYKENEEGMGDIGVTPDGEVEKGKFQDLMNQGKVTQAELSKIFLDISKESNFTAEETKAAFIGMLLATGKTTEEAAAIAGTAYEGLVNEVGEIDWGKAMENNAQAAQDALDRTLSINPDMLLTDATKEIGPQIQGFVNAFGAAWNDADSPEQAKEYINQFSDVFGNEWQDMFDRLVAANEEAEGELAKLGVTGGESLQKLYEQSPEKLQVLDSVSLEDFSKMGDFIVLQSEFIKMWAASTPGAGNITDMAEALTFLNGQAKAMTYAEGAQAVKDWMGNIDIAAKHARAAEEAAPHGVTTEAMAIADEDLYNTQQTSMKAMNKLNAGFGYKLGDTYAEAYNNFIYKVVDATKAAENKIAAGGGLFNIRFKQDDYKTMLKAGFAGVQSDLSDMISEDFDNRMNAAIDANAKAWDDKIDGLRDAQEKATKALEDRQDKEQERFDKRWERRKNAVEAAYDARIDKINDAIEAEKKAEEVRKAIFEAEKTRLQRLTEMANKSIDFNMALETGDLDEAAKIRNDMDAAAAEWALADAEEAGAKGSQKRQDRLGDRADDLGDQKDKALDALKKREEAERKSMERRQEAERDHLKKIQDMNMDALQEQADAAKDAYQNDWENRRNSLDHQLETFKSFVPKNQKQLKAWMKIMGIDYNNFGLDVLNPKSKQWGGWFKDSMTSNVREAGIEIASDNMWEKMGGSTAESLLMGMGFTSMEKFKKFVLTGKLPDDFGEKPKGEYDVRGNWEAKRKAWEESRHEGGIVGSGSGSSRKGVARTAPLHPSERIIRAQVGERIIDRDTAKKYAGTFDAMERGIMDPISGRGGASVGVAGIVSGVVNHMLARGVGGTLADAAEQGLKRRAANMTLGAMGTGYIAGTGSPTRPIRGVAVNPRGVHDTTTGFPAVDFSTPVNTPVYAVANGTIAAYKEFRGHEPRNAVQNGYRSYGKVLFLKTDAGPTALYAHLNQAHVKEGQKVKGGAKIASSGNTGYSTGPHLHFGASNGPLAWLKTGGMTLNDGMAMLHRGETVLTKPLTEDLKSTIQAFGKASREAMSGRNRTRSRDDKKKKKKKVNYGTGPGTWGKDKTKLDKARANGAWTYLSPFMGVKTGDYQPGKRRADNSVAQSILSGTFNVLKSSSNSATKNSLLKLMKSTDVLSLQEMSNQKKKLIPWIISQGWGAFVKGMTGLMWNKDVYSASNLQSKAMSKRSGLGHNNVVYGKFRPKQGGSPFWQMSAHTIWGGQKGASKTQMEQYRFLGNLNKTLGEGGLPVVMAGDFNLNGKSTKFLEKVLGMKTDRRGGTDHLFYKGLTGGKTKAWDLSSDHPAITTNFSVPSHKNGAENIMFDNTLVNLHKRESVLTAEQSDKFRRLADNIDNVAAGAGAEYNLTMNVVEPGATADEIADKVIKKIERAEARRPQRRR